MLTELEQLTGNEPLRRSLTYLTIAEIIRHALAEHCLPVSDRPAASARRQRIADQHIAQHERLEQTLKARESHDLTSAEFSLFLSRLDAEVCFHTQSEEQQLFPLLDEHLSQEELTTLGRKAVEAKQKASIPYCYAETDSPLLNKMIAAGTGLVERVRTYLCDLIYPF